MQGKRRSSHEIPTEIEQVPLLKVQGLSKRFANGNGSLEVLREIFLEVGPGEIVSIIGPSGCGKSTIFNVLAGLVPPNMGKIRLDGQVVPHIRGRVAYMQQKDLLLPWRSALDNAILGMEIQGVTKAVARGEAMAILKVFGLEGFENHYPHELSGGMRQRVALMRTILCRKPILLLDEPFGALDTFTRGNLQRWLLRIWIRFRPSILLVTHDVEEALLLSDRIYVMTSRPSTIKAVMPVKIERPRQATQQAVVDKKAELLGFFDDDIAESAS